MGLGRFRSVNGQIEYLLRCALQDADVCPDRIAPPGAASAKRSASIVPAAGGASRGTPRDVRASATGRIMLPAAALVVLAMWGSIVLGRRADIAGRPRRPLCVRAHRHGGRRHPITETRRRDDHSITAHYRYTPRPRAHGGTRCAQRTRGYALGSPLRSGISHPNPRRVARRLRAAAAGELAGHGAADRIGLSALVLIRWCGVSEPAHYGRPPWPPSRKSRRKKRTRERWMVHYEWTTLSGATSTGNTTRKEKMSRDRRVIPIVYDRDNIFRHSKYPMAFVTVVEVKVEVNFTVPPHFPLPLSMRHRIQHDIDADCDASGENRRSTRDPRLPVPNRLEYPYCATSPP